MKKETLDALDEAIMNLVTNTSIMRNDIKSLIALYDENRKQIIITTLGIMKQKIDFLETELNLLLIMLIMNSCSTASTLNFPPSLQYKSDELHQHTKELILY